MVPLDSGKDSLSDSSFFFPPCPLDLISGGFSPKKKVDTFTFVFTFTFTFTKSVNSGVGDAT